MDITDPGLALAAVGGFVLGSVPSGYLLARWLAGVDLRRFGSGGIGATNAGRALGVTGWLATLAMDTGKGWLAVIVGDIVSPSGGAMVGLVAAVAGHCFTPWLGGRGGKGVATMLGGALAVDVPTGLNLIGIAAAVAMLTRFMSLGSLLSAAGLPLLMASKGATMATLGCSLAVSLLIVLQHRTNIRRLWRGEEPRIGRRETPGSGPRTGTEPRS